MERLTPSLLAPVDLLVVGGGIHGAGIAAEAAQRGLSVILCEQNDLASGTSSASTKLIHGGLRYLEHFAFRFVRDSLKERALLLRKAPHLIAPAQFIMPWSTDRRPFWLIRIGLFLYDNLAPWHRLVRSKVITLSRDLEQNPLESSYTRAFCYTDCRTDDARLVIANAQLAHASGAKIYRNFQCVQATTTPQGWHITLFDKHHQQSHTVQAKAIINATGPWASQFQQGVLKQSSLYSLRWVKGSHIVTHQLYQGDQSYVLQNIDGRIIFVMPYQKYYTLIGTTEVPYDRDLEKIAINPQEAHYLCHAVNRYFYKKIHPKDIVHSWSGIRPLLNDASADPSQNTRDYELDLQLSDHQLPALSIFGGKLTTYRQLSVEAVEILYPYFPKMKRSPRATIPLPGGNLGMDTTAYIALTLEKYPWLFRMVAERYVQTYGTNLHHLLENSHHISDLGEDFGHGLFEKEVRYLIEKEWAHTAEDILWRRTKLGLLFNEAEYQRLEKYLER